MSGDDSLKKNEVAPELAELTEAELKHAQGGLLLPAVQKVKLDGPSGGMDKNADGKLAD